MIEESNLALVADRKPDRPKGSSKAAKRDAPRKKMER